MRMSLPDFVLATIGGDAATNQSKGVEEGGKLQPDCF